MTRLSPRWQRGFTLIEIMVVVVILGLLAAVVVTQTVGKIDDARITKAKQDIRELETALTLYRLDNFRYPTSEQGLDALVKRPADPALVHWKDGGYVKRMSKDPWDRPYVYESPGAHGDFDLYSLGADGQPGGEKNDADIGNWNLEE
ncbi:MAG TPA: type II secretion system major pseudopilin GspG [Steroidobacteraceae bacterium]|nr:type II secretion system major pseudopilin GspG [Steroidobacteraceae bacterium]